MSVKNWVTGLCVAVSIIAGVNGVSTTNAAAKAKKI